MTCRSSFIGTCPCRNDGIVADFIGFNVIPCPVLFVFWGGVEGDHAVEEGLGVVCRVFAGASCPGCYGVGEGDCVGYDYLIVGGSC